MTRRRFFSVLLATLAVAGASLGGAAAALPTVRLAVVHVVRGCHAWAVGTKIVGPSEKLVVKRGARLVIRVSCPMDFDFVQTRGPKLALGPARFYAGTSRTIVFRKAGLYRLKGTNVQSSEERGLGTLGPDNVLALTVRVK